MAMSPYNYRRYGYNSRHYDPFDPSFMHFPTNVAVFEFPSPTTPNFIPQPPPPPLAVAATPPCEISTFSRTKIEYKETPEAHHFRVDLAGLRQEEVKVHVEDGKVLHICGQRSSEKRESKGNFHHFERRHGEFASRFTLPKNAKPERMRTHMENNGVLTVIIPKEKRDIVEAFRFRFYRRD